MQKTALFWEFYHLAFFDDLHHAHKKRSTTAPAEIGKIYTMIGKDIHEVPKLSSGDIGVLQKLDKTITANTLCDPAKQKKIPMRSCVVTGEKLPKRELLRIVRTIDGTVVCDLSGKINGRGAYIKKDVDVLEKAKKTKILEKRLECTISDETYEEVKNEIEKM